MLGKKHLYGVSAKEQREYEPIEVSAVQAGRCGSLAREVAARTVMKHHNAKRHRVGR